MFIPGTNPLTILIADGHPVFREGIKTILKSALRSGVQIAAEVDNGKDLLQQVKQHQPHIVLLDVQLPDTGGIEVTRYIKANWPQVVVIGLAASGDVELFYNMLLAGARGYLMKNMEQHEVVQAVQAITADQSFYFDAGSRPLLELMTPALIQNKKKNATSFSEKELEMIRLICQQRSIKEIAGTMHSSLRNIEDYSRKIREKAGAKNLVGIALFAIKHHIVQLGEL